MKEKIISDTKDFIKEFFTEKEIPKIECPKCKADLELTYCYRRPMLVTGILCGISLAAITVRAGAVAGSCVPGIGTFIGLVAGAGAGFVMGDQACNVLNEKILLNYECPDCGCACRFS